MRLILNLINLIVNLKLNCFFFLRNKNFNKHTKYVKTQYIYIYKTGKKKI
jgi:hypothetical protein